MTDTSTALVNMRNKKIDKLEEEKKVKIGQSYIIDIMDKNFGNL